MEENRFEDKPKPIRKPVKPMRLYLTGIVTGALLLTMILLICDMLNLHPFSGTPMADSTYDLAKTVEGYIEKYYWKSGVPDEQFAQMAAKGIVTALGDPYSVYLTPGEMTQLKEHNDGDYAGIGIAISEDTETKRKVVTKVEKDGPSDKAGMKVRDVIVMVDGVDVTKASTDEVVTMVRGKVGVKHVIVVLRDEERIELTVETANIVNKSVFHQVLKNEIGYLQITSFDRETPKQFRSAIDDLEKKNIKGLILDVRNNPGGVLSAVLSVLDRLLPEGPVLTETRKGQKDTIYRSTSKEDFTKPMVVLINGKSASAAEVFAGALQDRKKIRLIGEKSYGKGVMQSIYTFPGDQGGIKLTTGEYLLPSGRSIHEKGLTPDVGVAFSGKSTEEYGTNSDNQLVKAMEVITTS
ncbi:MAG: S41 family peptidase [Eubacterium sp.]|nr:S41 family peptidase [Eubacterium sp.]